jgi:uncharacterized protein YndB with AHSA1/START domain/DNA-binding transcriptional ArsR family regulator
MIESDELVFKALADSTRRALLDRLFVRDGLTLTELESAFPMTRFGVMKHLRVLEDAHLVLTRRSRRTKLHFLNPVPIRLIHDRWIDKYTERRVSALTDLKAQLENNGMSNSNPVAVATQIYEVYIKAAPEAIWAAITKPEWSVRYGYQGPVEYDLRPGGAFRANASAAMVAMGIQGTLVDGEVLEVEPPRKLVQTYRFLFSDEHRAEGFSRVTWEIVATASGFSRLTVTHELDDKPIMASMVASKFDESGSGGWSWILSDLKSVLETGKALGG